MNVLITNFDFIWLSSRLLKNKITKTVIILKTKFKKVYELESYSSQKFCQRHRQRRSHWYLTRDLRVGGFRPHAFGGTCNKGLSHNALAGHLPVWLIWFLIHQFRGQKSLNLRLALLMVFNNFPLRGSDCHVMFTCQIQLSLRVKSVTFGDSLSRRFICSYWYFLSKKRTSNQ